MLTYSHIKRLRGEGKNAVLEDWNYDINEDIQKKYKCHRDAITFEGKFISNIINDAINGNARDETAITEHHSESSVMEA